MENKSRPTKASVSFTLFLYREELHRRKTQYLRLSKTKLKLTDELITKKVNSIKGSSIEDLQAVNRELKFKKELKQSISRLCKLQQLGIKNPNPNAPSTEL